MDEYLRKKSDFYAKPLKHKKVYPCDFVRIENGKVISCGEYKPFILKAGESAILRFPCHLVGYFGYHLESRGYIADSPTVLKFIPGEFISEITRPQEEYVGALSSGWLQREEKASVGCQVPSVALCCCLCLSGCLQRHHLFYPASF